MHLQTTTTSHFLTRLQVASPAKMITYGQQADCLSGGIMVSRSSKANVSSVVARSIEDPVGWIKQRRQDNDHNGTDRESLFPDPGQRILARDVG